MRRDKTEYNAYRTGDYQSKTWSTRNTHIEMQTDYTQGTEGGESEGKRARDDRRHDRENRQLNLETDGQTNMKTRFT